MGKGSQVYWGRGSSSPSCCSHCAKSGAISLRSTLAIFIFFDVYSVLILDGKINKRTQEGECFLEGQM